MYTYIVQSFSNSAIEALKYYVYALINPIDNQIFYIGKGKDNRVFQSLKAKNIPQTNLK